MLNYELSMMAWFSGCVARPIHADRTASLSWEQIRREIRPLGPHWAPTGLIEIENTHNMAGGTVYPLEAIDEICDGAHALGLKVHMDGARVFNAAAACGHTVREIAAKCDTVMFCLSKGLGAPVGSMLAGTREAIDRATPAAQAPGRRHAPGRRAGGGRADRARGDARSGWPRTTPTRGCWPRACEQIPGIEIDPATVETNIVIFDVERHGADLAPRSARGSKRAAC